MAITSTDPTRHKGPRLTRILLWFAGVSYEEVRRNDEVATYTARGGVVLFTVLLAGMSATVLGGTLGLALGLMALPPSIYMFGIASFDRWIMSTPAEPTFWGRLKTNLPRIVLVSIPVGMVVGVALHLYMFSGAIARQIEEDRRDGLETAVVDANTTSAPAVRKKELETNLDTAKAEMSAAKEAADAAVAMYIAEINNPQRVGVGPRAEEIQRTIVDPARARLAAAEAAVGAAEQVLVTEGPGLASAVDAAIGTAKETIENDDDLLTRLKALDAVMEANPGTKTEAQFLFVFFIALDALPAMLKIMSKPTKTDSDKRTAVARREAQNALRLAAATSSAISEVFQASELDLAVAQVAAERISTQPVDTPTEGHHQPGRERRSLRVAGAIVVAAIGLLASATIFGHDGTDETGTATTDATAPAFGAAEIAVTGSEACDLLSSSSALSQASAAAIALLDPSDAKAGAVFRQAANDLKQVGLADGDLALAGAAAESFGAVARAPGDPAALLDVSAAATALAEEVNTKCVPI